MNRAQRRAAAKKRGHGRVTPKGGMSATVEYHDPEGRLVRTERISGEHLPQGPPPVDPEVAKRRMSAHAVGLWLPGDPF